MNITGNTIFITGGGTGIGRGLAEAFHARGNAVIISGRRQGILDRVTAANPGMTSVQLDVEDADSIRATTTELFRTHPEVNVLVNNAGILRAESVHDLARMRADAETTISTNLLAPLRLTNAFLQHFHDDALTNPDALHAIINVSSGLAFVPLVIAPTYNATKAAIHAYSESLRAQLNGTTTSIIELIPPMVATDIVAGQSSNPHALALDAYIDQTMLLLEAEPDATEIVIDSVRFLRYAEREGRYQSTFSLLNA